MKSVVSEKGQVTIPKELRDRLGLRPGTVLDFAIEDSRLVAVKRAAGDAVSALYGTLSPGTPTDELMEHLRGAPDATR